MPPKKTQVFAGKRKSNKNNGPQMKKGKKASLPPQQEDSNESGEDDEAEFIKASVAKQLNGGSDPSSEDSEPINQKPQRVAGKQSARKKKTQAKVTAPESDDDESDEDDGEAENDSDDEDQEEDVAPRGAKLKKPNKVVKQQAKPKAGSSEDDDDDDDDEIDEDDDDGGIDEDDDEDDLSMGSEGDDDLEFDEDGDEETAGPDMESDPESEDEPVEVSSKKSSITAARKKQAESDSDDEDETLALPSSKPGKPKHKKLGSESDDESGDEQEESPQKKKLKAAKADEKQIDEKLEEIFDSYKTTEAEVEQFRKNYVTMVRSWLFIPRVPVGATAEEIKSLHPKITKVKLPTKTKDKSFAFLNFASTRDADEVLKELSKQTCVVAGEPVKIQKAREFGMTPPAYINRRKLAIIACPKETTQEELCRLFPQATTVWLSKNARTDTVENYLSFPDEDTAREALAENGTVSLHGKCCALFFDNYSYKKKTAGRKLKKKLGAGKAVDVDKITPDAPKRPKKFSKRDEDQSRNGRSFSSNLTEDRVDKEDGFRSNFRGGSRGGHGGFRGKDRDTFQPRGRGSFGRGRGGSDRGGRGGFNRGGGGRGGFDRGDRGSSDRGGRGGFDRGGFGRGGRGGSSRGRGGFDRGGRGGFDRGGRGGFDRGGRGGFNRGGRGGSDRGGRGSFGRGGGRGGFNRSNRTEMD